MFNFFATNEDLCDIFEWIGGVGDFVFLEQYSRPDQKNRVYNGFPKDELIAENRLDHVPIWVANAGAPPIEHHVRFDKDTGKELKASGRTILKSPAIIVFHRVGKVSGPWINPVELHFETETSVSKLKRYTPAHIAEVDWVELAKSLNVIKKHVRTTAAGKWRSMPVMAGVANRLNEEGGTKLSFWGAEGII